MKESREPNVFEFDPDDDYLTDKHSGDADKALDALRDYYGTAAALMPGAFGDLESVDYRDDCDLFDEARRLGLM